MTPSDAHPTHPPDLDALRAENAHLARELSALHRTNVELASYIAAILADCYQDDLEEAVAAKLVPDDESSEPTEPREPAAAARPEEGASEEAAEADPVDPIEDFTVHMLLELFGHLGELRQAGRSLCGLGLVLASNAPGERGKLDGLLLGIAPDAPMTRGELLDGMFHGVLKLRADHPDVFDAGAGSPTVLSPDHPAYEQFLELVKEHNIALPPLPSPSPEEAP